jgi:hypothetical protein
LDADNPSHGVKLARRNTGFAEVGRIPAGFLHEGREIDELMMARRIVP